MPSRARPAAKPTRSTKTKSSTKRPARPRLVAKKRPTTAAKKTKPKARPNAKAKPKPKAKTKPKPKTKVKTRATRRATVAVPPPLPSERVVSALALLPTERPLTDEERAAMKKVARTALRTIGGGDTREEIVRRVAAFVDEVRSGAREAPSDPDVCLGLGVLWGEQVRAQVGWIWVHLTYPDGFASYALVPDDRAFACFPLNRIPDAMRAPNGATRVNTSVQLFYRIRTSELPARRPNAYVVIG